MGRSRDCLSQLLYFGRQAGTPFMGTIDVTGQQASLPTGRVLRRSAAWVRNRMNIYSY